LPGGAGDSRLHCVGVSPVLTAEAPVRQTAVWRFLKWRFLLKTALVGILGFFAVALYPGIADSPDGQMLLGHFLLQLFIVVLVLFPLRVALDRWEAKRIRKEWQAGRLTIEQLTPEQKEVVLTHRWPLIAVLHWPNCPFEKALCWGLVSLVALVIIIPLLVALVLSVFG